MTTFPAPSEKLLSFGDAFWDFGSSTWLFLLCLLFRKHFVSSIGLAINEFYLFSAVTFSFYALGQLSFLAYAQMRRFKSEMVGSYVPPVRKEPEADQDFRFED